MYFLVLLNMAFAQELSTEKPPTDSQEQIVDAQHINASLVLKVEKREDVANDMVQKLELLGGYYSLRTDQLLQLRVPTAEMETFTQFCANQGVVASRTFNSEGLSQELSELHGKLKSREELLGKYFQILEKSKAESVINVEREVIRLISDIENLKAQKNNATMRSRFSNLEIRFQFKDRRQPIANGSSAFDWLNTLNMGALIEEFQYNHVDRSSRSVNVAFPEGFAQYKVKKETRAASFDNVLYRARNYKSKQDASDEFWAEAVRNRMEQAGYFGYQSEDIETESLDNNRFLIKTIAPYGQDDFSYWIAFSSDKEMITIIEVVGEVSAFEKNKQQILTAITAP
jgi:hypothetical protein